MSTRAIVCLVAVLGLAPTAWVREVAPSIINLNSAISTAGAASALRVLTSQQGVHSSSGTTYGAAALQAPKVYRPKNLSAGAASMLRDVALDIREFHTPTPAASPAPPPPRAGCAPAPSAAASGAGSHD